MKGILLAGGKGTRLLPATRVLNKHMVPILNRPMITYPLETLKSFGIDDIMVVSGGGHIGGIAEFLGDGSDFGVNLTYKVQRDAGGIAQALGLARRFADDSPVTVILGDNIFDNTALQKDEVDPYKAYIFTKVDVPDMRRFGVLRIDHETGVKTIIEKPDIQVWSDSAITGLYIYPNEVFEVIPSLVPSQRGELEISDVNDYFLKESNLEARSVGGFWSDAGTPASLKEVIDWAYLNEFGST